MERSNLKSITLLLANAHLICLFLMSDLLGLISAMRWVNITAFIGALLVFLDINVPFIERPYILMFSLLSTFKSTFYNFFLRVARSNYRKEYARITI